MATVVGNSCCGIDTPDNNVTDFRKGGDIQSVDVYVKTMMFRDY